MGRSMFDSRFSLPRIGTLFGLRGEEELDSQELVFNWFSSLILIAVSDNFCHNETDRLDTESEVVIKSCTITSNNQ